MIPKPLMCKFGLHKYTHQAPNVIIMRNYGAYVFSGVFLICQCGKTKDANEYIPGLPIIEPT